MRRAAALLAACALAAAVAAPAGRAAGARPLDIRATVRLGADDGVTLRQSGTFAGAPLGRGSLRMSTRVGLGCGAVVSFVLANGRGSVRGRADVALTFRGASISYDGRASIASGTGAFRGLRASGLRVTGRGEVAGDTFAVRITGRVAG